MNNTWYEVAMAYFNALNCTSLEKLEQVLLQDSRKYWQHLFNDTLYLYQGGSIFFFPLAKNSFHVESKGQERPPGTVFEN
jgi:hypothetical protein